MSWSQVKQQASQLFARQQFSELHALLQQCQAEDPADAEYWYLFAGVKGIQADFAAAEAYCRRALSLQPEHALSWFRLGNSLDALNNKEAALQAYDQALRLQPDFEHIWNNKGVTLMALSRPVEAEQCYRRALALQNSNPDFITNLGLALAAQNRLQPAIQQFEQVLRIDQNHVEANWSLANAWLLAGDFARGWAYYPWRWRRANKQVRQFNKPAWHGQALAGKRLYVYPEQGLGDAIQFARFLPLLKQQGATLIVECAPALLELFRGIAAIDKLTTSAVAADDFDYHAAIGDLPGQFVTHESDIPDANGYLSVQTDNDYQLPNAQAACRKLGLVWAGNPKHANDFNRSCSLAALESVLGSSELQFYSLQKQKPADVKQQGVDAELLRRYSVVDLAPRLHTMNDTAGYLQQLDGLVSVDTSVAHLAGALGVTTWLLLPYAPDWRWQLQRTDTPWYSSVRLLRQNAIGDWAGVSNELVRQLQQCKPA